MTQANRQQRCGPVFRFEDEMTDKTFGQALLAALAVSGCPEKSRIGAHQRPRNAGEKRITRRKMARASRRINRP
jgi:hypothetical protein